MRKASTRRAHLATINDAPTQAYLQQWYANYSPWIGLTDQVTEGTWLWADGQEVTFTNWNASEPNDTDSRADYALLDTDGLWYDNRTTNTRRGLIDLGPLADSDGDQVPDIFDVHPTDPLNAWDVREAGGDGQFDTPDDVIYSPYLTATYVSGTAVSLALRDGPLGTGHYRLTVNDTITDRLGNALDGNGDEAAGAPYHYEFDVLLSDAFVFEGRGNTTRASAAELVLTEDPAGSGLFLGRGLGSQYPVAYYDYWTDTDYWRFEALAGDKVAIAVDTPASGLDPYVELRDASDSNVASDNDGGPGADDYISYYTIPSDGTYYVRVGDYYYNTTAGSYEVRVELARGIQLETDRSYNNNSFANADVLTLEHGDVGHLLATVAGTVMAPESATWDQDRYRLGTLTAGNQVALSVQLPSDSSLVARLRLLKADGTELADEDGDPWDGHFLGTIPDGQDGVYYAEVGSYWSYGDHRYLVTDSMTWSQAQALAVSLGGNLVTINDAAEQQWVDNTFDQFGNFWLGLTDEASEGTWVWASGEAVTYTNWNSGEPNTTSYDYAYMENGAGGWRDNSATGSLRAVLEFDTAGIDGGGPGSICAVCAGR